MEYNAATMVASKHHARKVVLNHSTQSPLADLKEQVENSRYNTPEHLEKCLNRRIAFSMNLKGSRGTIRLKTGPVRQEIFSGPAPGKGKKFVSNRPSYSIIPHSHFRHSNNVQARGRRRGRGRGRGAAQKALPWKGPANQQGQGQGSQQNQKKGGVKNSRGGKKENAK